MWAFKKSRKLLWPILRRNLPLAAFSELNDAIHLTPESFLKSVFGLTSEQLFLMYEEYKNVDRKLGERYCTEATYFPKYYAIGTSTSFLLYCITRIMKPLCILETGVANGHSSYIFLSALLANHVGRLYSTEINKNCGQLVPAEMRTLWNLLVLKSAKDFSRVVKSLSKVDLFLHDSGDHSYGLQMYEYLNVKRKMSPGGYLLSDDVDKSFAFVDFAKSIGCTPSYLVDAGPSGRYTKIFGAIQWPKNIDK
jgi:hypothetical protein